MESFSLPYRNITLLIQIQTFGSTTRRVPHHDVFSVGPTTMNLPVTASVMVCHFGFTSIRFTHFYVTLFSAFFY